jgi:hypothetical protein
MSVLKTLLLLIALWTPYASADVSLPGNGTQPVKVKMSIFILDLDGIDNVNQTFQANLFYMASWNDPRLAHSGTEEVNRPLDEVWNPRLQILNQQRTVKTFPDVVKIDPRGNVTQRQRLWGNFSQPLNLHDFPFDHQQLEVSIIATGYNPEEVEMVSYSEMTNGVGKNLSIPDWSVTNWKAEPIVFRPYSELMEPLAGFALSVSVERRYNFLVAKVIIPLILIMAMSWVVFWMDPKDGGSSQIGVGVTAMLTLVAFTFAIGGNLPKVPYLTRLDYFVLFSTMLVFLSLAEVTFTSYQARIGRVELARSIDRWARWCFPLMLLLITMGSLGPGWLSS